jgi:hypothetical protein
MIRLGIVTYIPGPDPGDTYEILKCWDNMVKYMAMESSSIGVVERIMDELTNYNAKISDGQIEFEDESQASMFVLKWS